MGKIINIGSRSASFIHKYFHGELSSSLDDQSLYEHFLSHGDNIAQHYAQKRFNLVCQELIALADKANQYVDLKKPWQMAKNVDKIEEVGRVCTTCLHLFWVLSVYLLPIIPETSRKMLSVFQKEATHWKDASTRLLSCKITAFPRILERLSLDMCPA